jgi:type II secretory pathway pseudopilin PulG
MRHNIDLPELCPAGHRPGVSLVELIVALAVSAMVLLAVLSILIAENARASQQRELGDGWFTLRSATDLLAYDLRQASATGGDLRAISDTAFTVRSRLGSGTVCARTLNAYALTAVSGEFTAATGDSALVLAVMSTPAWRGVRVSAVGAPGTIGPATCVWSGSAPPTVGVRLLVGTAADTTNVTVGSQMHAFRSTEYGITTSSGRRWLARRVSGGNWELLAGPLQPNGLQVTYFTNTGSATTTPSAIAAVRITLRSESHGRQRNGERMQDSVSFRVALRN